MCSRVPALDTFGIDDGVVIGEKGGESSLHKLLRVLITKLRGEAEIYAANFVS